MVDWNQDGALDLVTSNRSGPQIRFLANRNAGGGHFLALRLEGSRSNRDAVGARAELLLADGRRLVRSVRAGDGYLSQSSKWLHFGLGESAEIAGLEVRWPSGAKEELQGISANRWYRLTEGSGEAREWTPKARGSEVESLPEAFSPHRASSLPKPPGRTFLLHPLPLFMPSYLSTAGEPAAFPEDPPGPRLINLWASWCANCRPELSDFLEEKDQLAEAGLEVLALTVDEEKDLPAAEAFLDELGWDFLRGRSTPELLDYLNLVYEVVVDQPRGMAVPMSFLLDEEQRLLAIYRGPVTPEQLVEDLESAARGTGEGAMPFAGRWANRPSGRDLQRLANLLSSHGLGDLAVKYLDLAGSNQELPDWRREALEESKEAAGRALLAGGRLEEAERLLRDGLEKSPGKASLLYELARVLLEQGKVEEALESFEEALAGLPDSAPLRADYGFALIRAGQVEKGVEQFEKTLEVARPGEEAEVKALYNLAVYREENGEREEALELLEALLEAPASGFRDPALFRSHPAESGAFRGGRSGL